MRIQIDGTVDSLWRVHVSTLKIFSSQLLLTFFPHQTLQMLSSTSQETEMNVSELPEEDRAKLRKIKNLTNILRVRILSPLPIALQLLYITEELNFLSGNGQKFDNVRRNLGHLHRKTIQGKFNYQRTFFIKY